MSEGNQDKREDPQDLQSDRTQTDNESGDPARLAPANSRLTDVPAGVIAAVAVHGLLFFALFNVFQWNTDTETVYAELWAPEDASGMSLKGTAQETEEEAPDNKAAPALEEPTAEELQLKKEAQERPEAQRLADEKARAEAEAKAQAEAQKLLEEERREAARREAERLEAERLEAEKRAAEEAEQKRREEDIRIAEEKRLAEEKRIAEEKRRQAELAEEMRRAELARITGAPAVTSGRVGSTRGTPGVERSMQGKLSAAYASRVISCIRPFILFSVPSGIARGTHVAVYSVSLLPNGKIAETPRMTQSSGLPAFDRAVRHAISRCNPFPRPLGNTPMPRRMEISFDPVEDAQP